MDKGRHGDNPQSGLSGLDERVFGNACLCASVASRSPWPHSVARGLKKASGGSKWRVKLDLNDRAGAAKHPAMIGGAGTRHMARLAGV